MHSTPNPVWVTVGRCHVWSGRVEAVKRAAVGLLIGLVGWGAWAADVAIRVQDEAGQPLLDAVVFLDSAEAARAVKPLIGVEMGQQSKTFTPPLLVVTKGTAVDFPNRDTVRHHVYSFSPAKRFELKLYVGTPANPVVFDQAGVVVLGCNIHDQMLAHIVVVDTPWYGTTAASGQVQFTGVPAGSYILRVWHSRLPVGQAAQAKTVQVGAVAIQAQVVMHQLEAP